MKNMLLLIIVLMFCSGIVVLGEILCRKWVHYPLLGVSGELFVAQAFGPSKGNARGVEAMGYGKKVYTDRYGFRVPAPLREKKKSCGNAMLLLGDSVGFGLGVDEPETLAGRLRERLPSVCIYNTSVIGYCTTDYRNVVEMLPFPIQDIGVAVLVFCLNDLLSLSTAEVDPQPATFSGDTGSPADFVDRMKRMDVFRDLNLYFRARSKLYLLVRNAFFDLSRSNWVAVKRLYEDENEPDFEAMMRPISDIAEIFDRRGIPFGVIIAPYEFQLRDPAQENRLPQKKLAEFFRREGVDFVDPIPDFLRTRRPSKDFFLPHDPMHFSSLGHEVMFHAVMTWLSPNPVKN